MSIFDNIIGYLYWCEWWSRTFKSNMLQVNRNLGIYPPRINEFVVAKRYVAMVLRIY